MNYLTFSGSPAWESFSQLIQQDPHDKILFLSLLTRLTLAQLEMQMGFLTCCAKRHLAQSRDCILSGSTSCKMHNTVGLSDKEHKLTVVCKQAEASLKETASAALKPADI